MLRWRAAIRRFAPGYPLHPVGADVAVHYAPADPSVFAFDRAADRRGYGCGAAALAGLTAAGAAAMLVGLVLLG